MKRRAAPGWCGAALSLLMGGLTAPPARAAGGAHVVDDADVEKAGACHLESWIIGGEGGAGLVNLSPACTRRAWPRLELGAGVQHLWGGGGSDTTAGPAMKLNLRRSDSGVGLAAAATAAWSLGSGRLETGGLVTPLTLVLSDRVRLNLNPGWSYSRTAANRNALVLGSQVEVQLRQDTGLMVEVFGRDRGQVGAQLGYRWTPGGGAIDVDVLAGHRVDGTTPLAVTLGLTVRR